MQLTEIGVQTNPQKLSTEGRQDRNIPVISFTLRICNQNEAPVSTQREGEQIVYSFASEEAQAVMQVLYQQYYQKPGKDQS